MNPKEYSTWPFSSLKYYQSKLDDGDWIKPERILALFGSDSYSEFIKTYEHNKKLLKAVKNDIAAG